MANTLQLLTQIRKALAEIGDETRRSQITAILAAADVAINTLQLQESTEFYREYIAAGKALVEAGWHLVPREHAQAPASLVGQEHASLDGRPPAVALPSSLRGESSDAQIAAIRQSLVAIVAHLDEHRSAEAKRYVVRMSEWETMYHRHHLEQVPRPTESASASVTQANLQRYLQQRFPDRTGLTVTQFMPLDGGFSKKTVLFETEDQVNGRQALVMRAEQPFDLLCYEGSDLTQEFFMIKLMRNSGLPTAEPLWLEDDRTPLGCRFLVSRKAEGRVYGGALGSEEQVPQPLLQSIMATFIQMHSIRITPNDPLARQSHLNQWLPFQSSLHATTTYYVTEWLPRMIERTQIPTSPQIQRALKWLQLNIPESDETPVVMHGDFSFNNLILGEGGVSAVLDWESSRLGDPAEDIVWTQPNIASHMGMPEFLQIYRAGTGRQISEKRLAYARVVKCLLNAVACLSAYQGLETRNDTNLNLSILAYKYMGLFGAQFNSLIESAERQ